MPKLADRLAVAVAAATDLGDFIARLEADSVLGWLQADKLRETMGPGATVEEAREFLLGPGRATHTSTIWNAGDWEDEAPAKADGKPKPAPEPVRDPLLLELLGYRDRLVPGAAELLAERWRDELGHKSPHEIARAVAERFAPARPAIPAEGPGGLGVPARPEGVGRKFLDPSKQAPAEHPVMGALRRASRAGVIPESSVGSAWNAWAADLATLDDVRAAEEVRKRLGEWEHRKLTSPAYRPRMPLGADTVLAVALKHFGQEVGDVGRAEQVAVDNRHLGQGCADEAAVVRGLAIALRVPPDDGRRDARRSDDRTRILYGPRLDGPSREAALKLPEMDEATRRQFASL